MRSLFFGPRGPRFFLDEKGGPVGFMVSALDCCELARKQAGADGMRTRKSLLSRQGVFFVFVFYSAFVLVVVKKGNPRGLSSPVSVPPWHDVPAVS